MLGLGSDKKDDIRGVLIPPHFGRFCPRCFKLSLRTSSLIKKSRYCKRCDTSMILIDFENVQFWGVSDAKKIWRSLSFIVAFFTSLALGSLATVTGIMLKLFNNIFFWIFFLFPMFSAPYIIWFFFFIRWLFYSESDLFEYLYDLTTKCLPDDPSTLPPIDETRDQEKFKRLGIKNYRGMKVLRINEYLELLEMPKIKCRSCGEKIDYNAEFCTICGEKMK